MERDPVGMHIEALHRELDAYQKKHEDTSWILIVCKKEEGAVTSIGGSVKDVLCLITQVIVTMSLDEDDPVEFSKKITGMLSDLTPKGVKKLMKLQAEDDEDNEDNKVKDAIENLLKALKDDEDD